jgi:hypothetical protein
MVDKKKTEGKHKVVVIEEKIKFSDSVDIMKFNVDTLNKMTSGSCVLSSTISVDNMPPEKVAICKEGNTIKIFKVVEEKK